MPIRSVKVVINNANKPKQTTNPRRKLSHIHAMLCENKNQTKSNPPIYLYRPVSLSPRGICTLSPRERHPFLGTQLRSLTPRNNRPLLVCILLSALEIRLIEGFIAQGFIRQVCFYSRDRADRSGQNLLGRLSVRRLVSAIRGCVRDWRR